MDYDSFKCQSGDQCILAVGRCNGESNCDDGSDEVGCETNWGIPAILHNEECNEPFISDLQFRCADNACTHIEGRCNGINNCADGSDEESCSSLDLKRDLIIEATTGFSASVETLTTHSEVFYDRNYVFNSLGSFSGHSYIKMSNEDKHTPHSHVQMKLRSPEPLTVYIVRNSAHALPWLHSDGWSISDLQGVSYQGTRSTPHKEWATDNVANYEFSTDHFPEAPWISEVWQKTFPAGIVELRGDGGDGSYLIFVATVVTPPTPPPVDLWDQYLEDHHKCNNNIDVQYVSSQQACQQLAVANGHEFYSFRHNAQSSGHRCMSSATCDSPLDGRTNPWSVYSSNSGAVTVPVLQNGDFEAGWVDPQNWNRGFLYTSEIAGWTASGGTVAIPSNNGPWGSVAAGGGSFFLGLQSRGASVSQTVGGHMVGRTYKLKFTTAQRTNSPGGRNAILRVTTNNAEKINEVVASLAMETREVTYTAEASDVEIKFENVVASADQTVFIDAVEITEA